MTNKQYRYWGWGFTDHGYPKEKAKQFLKVLQERCGLKNLPNTKFNNDTSQYKIPKTKLPQTFVQKWAKKGLSLEHDDRLFHGAGKSYRDLIRIRNNTLERFPDGVLFLKTSDDLTSLFTDAQKHKITLIPFGGGSGVVGGTECVGPNQTPILVVNLTKLNRLLSIDTESRTARVEAGIMGPALEQILNDKGYTLGHFPQSFEFSSLGGWVATRSAGQNSTKYGKIEDMVQSLVLSTPKGKIETNGVPASATGPSLKQMIIGSEGIYGIITEVVVKINPLPKAQKFNCAFFKSFEQGIKCVRNIMQTDLIPSIVRLSDSNETALFLDLMLTKDYQKKIIPYWFKFKNLGKAPCFMIIASEGETTHVNFNKEKFKDHIRLTKGRLIEKNFASKWKKDRFELPYLRDDLMDHGFFIDTLETAAPWSKLMDLYESMKFAFLKQKSHQLVMACHLSHAYKDGASLYFTFMGVQKKEKEIKQWESIKKIATDVIMEHGGTLSHHHGIGFDHKNWMEQEQTPLGIEILQAVKKDLDPLNLLNPGKVF